jgi:NAD binding domain of 6-phosphogluconate dehydrogenase
MVDVGFIGLGIMGRPMAGHLLAAGHRLFGHNRSGISSELLEKGMTACGSGAEVAQKAKIIITMLPDTEDVEMVLFGKGGVAEGLTPGKIVVDMSSISPSATQEFAERIAKMDCSYLDAPVSGGEVGAKAATLTIMVGGPEKVLRSGPSPVPTDGQEHYADRWQWRRPDGEGCEPDYCGIDHSSRRRGLAVRFEGRSRPLQGPPGAARRLCFVEDFGSTR